MRWLNNLVTVFSLLMGAAACGLWVRGRTAVDEVACKFDRYLADGSAASNQVYLTSDRRLWLSVNWGHVGPYNGRLVWGYYVNADQSGGRPRLSYRHVPYDPWLEKLRAEGVGIREPGFGPVRWNTASRSKAEHGDDFRMVSVGVSHWLVALVLFVPPALRMYRIFKAFRQTKAAPLGFGGHPPAWRLGPHQLQRTLS